MRMLVLVAVAAVLLITAANDRRSAAADRRDESEAKVKELQKQRAAVLRDVAEQLAALHKNGRATPEEVIEAKLQALDAEAESENGAARVKLLEQRVEAIKELEKMAQARFESARDLKASVLKVTARRLEAEIALERAKAK